MGAVLGVELLEIPEHPLARVVHRALADLVSNCGSISRSAARVGQRLLALFEKRWGRVVHVRARGGVVLCTGGFVFNPRAVAKSAPAYSCCKMRIGTAGDTGSGIALGLSAGAAVAKLERCCGFRFINPPSALVGGVLVGPEGDRVCNEELYGATLCEKLVAEHGGKGYLVLDSVALRAARRQLGREPMGLFQLLFGSVNVFLNRKKGRSLEALALKLGINSRNLVDAIEDYNAGIDRGADSEGKADRYLRKIGSPPFYGIDCSVGSALFPTPYFTLGGLKVAGVTARAIDLDGREIPGLYAAGRTAIGISSNSYVSGLSVADCLFSGRNAGGDAASRALGTAAAKK